MPLEPCGHTRATAFEHVGKRRRIGEHGRRRAPGASLGHENPLTPRPDRPAPLPTRIQNEIGVGFCPEWPFSGRASARARSRYDVRDLGQRPAHQLFDSSAVALHPLDGHTLRNSLIRKRFESSLGPSSGGTWPSPNEFQKDCRFRASFDAPRTAKSALRVPIAD